MLSACWWSNQKFDLAAMPPLTSQTTTILCPSCGTEINVSDVLRHQVEEQLTHQLKEQFAGQQQLLDTNRQKLEQQQKELEDQKQQQQEQEQQLQKRAWML